MSGIALAFVLLIVLFALVIGLTFTLVGLALHLFIAGLVGWLADALVPGEIPFGWLGAIAAGLLGSFLGRLLIGSFGPAIFGVYIIPALLGAVILAFLANLFYKKAGPTDVRF